MIFAWLSVLLSVAIVIALFISFWIFIFGDSPFLPAPMKVAEEVMKEAKIKKGQNFYDIGAGDGRFVHIAASKYGANATGFEIDPSVYLLAKLRQWIFRWKGTVIRANTNHQSLKDADVVFCYMMPKCLKKFQKKFEKEMKKGSKIVSYTFKVGTLKQKKHLPKTKKRNSIYIYEL